MRDASLSGRDILAPPNLVSAARLALVPVALVLIAGGHRAAAVWTLAAMVATDGLDGYLARRLSRVTELGKVLDPLADKVAIDAVLGLLAARGEFPAWAFWLVLGRDVSIVAGAVWLRARIRAVPASIGVGKVALVALAAMTIVYVADLRALEMWLLVAGVAAVIVSGVAYAALAVRWHRDGNRGGARSDEREARR